MTIIITAVCGDAVAPWIDALADLRIRVFRAFPYLYDGSAAYEQEYLATYARSPESLFVLALDGNRVVGVATGIPMQDETSEFRAPLLAHGYKPGEIFYFGESVLLPEYRGQGIGVRFFSERERYARGFSQPSLGGRPRHRFRYTAFCAVERPVDHPLRPPGYQALDTFWQNRGYRRYPEFRSVYRWKDVDRDEASDHAMTYWMKAWD